MSVILASRDAWSVMCLLTEVPTPRLVPSQMQSPQVRFGPANLLLTLISTPRPRAGVSAICDAFCSRTRRVTPMVPAFVAFYATSACAVLRYATVKEDAVCAVRQSVGSCLLRPDGERRYDALEENLSRARSSRCRRSRSPATSTTPPRTGRRMQSSFLTQRATGGAGGVCGSRDRRRTLLALSTIGAL